VDLIVMATHGHTGWRRFLFGSVAEKAVRLAPCPVLTIQPPEEEAIRNTA
jgi:nucleotide-binding universal stress UspA family protein